MNNDENYAIKILGLKYGQNYDEKSLDMVT